MKKLKIDMSAVKIAKDLLVRLKTKRVVSSWYFDGYYQAVCDFLLDYTGENLRCNEFDAFNDEAIKSREVKQ